MQSTCVVLISKKLYICCISYAVGTFFLLYTLFHSHVCRFFLLRLTFSLLNAPSTIDSHTCDSVVCLHIHKFSLRHDRFASSFSLKDVIKCTALHSHRYIAQRILRRIVLRLSVFVDKQRECCTHAVSNVFSLTKLVSVCSERWTCVVVDSFSYPLCYSVCFDRSLHRLQIIYFFTISWQILERKTR